MPYTLNNQSIIDLAELGELNDPRTASELSTSKYLINNQTIQQAYDKKLIKYYPGYTYSKKADISNNFLIQNSNSYPVAKRGYRPLPAYDRLRWDSNTPGTYYINKFKDGEIYISSSANSRTGTMISSSQQNMKYVFIMLHGAGGGGASGLSTGKGGGGGGGGAFLYGCCYILEGSSRITIGSGGSGGSGGEYAAGGNSGDAGGSTGLILSGIVDVTAGGGYGGSTGFGGSGGVTTRINNSYYVPLDWSWSESAPGGGNRGGNDSSNGGGWPEFNLSAYNPENKTLDVGGGQGGTSPSGVSTGGGGGAGLWSGWEGGNGGIDGGAGGNGNKGAGGGGGGWVFAFPYWRFGAGGRGGDGYAAIYY